MTNRIAEKHNFQNHQDKLLLPNNNTQFQWLIRCHCCYQKKLYWNRFQSMYNLYKQEHRYHTDNVSYQDTGHCACKFYNTIHLDKEEQTMKGQCHFHLAAYLMTLVREQ